MRSPWAILLTLPLACGHGASALPDRSDPKALPPSAAQSPAQSTSELPGPARARGEAVLSINAACEGCHQEAATEWRGSLHQRAELEPAYQRAFAREPMPFCRGCHAPEAEPTEPTPPALAEVGVACVTCHLDQNDAVLAAPGFDRGPVPHALVRDARFASAGACAGCHEFTFPGTFARGPAALMQSTVSEHANSPFAATACASCHMPWVDGRRSHAFVSSRSPEQLQRAVHVQAWRTSETKVVVELHSRGVGHAFPTGDLFRRLEVSAEAVGPDESSLAQNVVWLKRHFKAGRGAHGRVLDRDDRLFDAPRRVDLEVGPVAVGRDIVWRVAYQRVAHPNGFSDSEAALEADIPLASGRLPPYTANTP